MVHDVYLELAEENEVPPRTLVRINDNPPARTPDGEYMPGVIHFAVGEYREGTNEAHFVTSEEKRFTIETADLLAALSALGLIFWMREGPDAA